MSVTKAYRLFQVVHRFPLVRTTQTRTLSTLWNLSGKQSPASCTKVTPKLTHYRSAHSQDVELAEFLREEIQEETKSETDVSKSLQGYEVERASDASLTFVKTANSETVRVHVNVNDSVQDSMPEVEDPDSVSESECKPPFTVEISKASGQTLSIHCSFPPVFPEDPENQEEMNDDLIQIDSVSLSDKPQDHREETYRLQGDIMDANMYDMMLGVLETRGVTINFVEGLIKYSTAYEHQLYIKFLKSLEQFVSK